MSDSLTTPFVAPSGDALDALLELVNIGVGLAADTISQLASRTVAISVPKIELIHLGQSNVDSALQLGGNSMLRVSQGFNGDLVGDAMLVINEEGGKRLAELLLGDVNSLHSIDPDAQSALLELGNIVINGIVGTLANQLEIEVSYELPVMQLRGAGQFVDLIFDLIDPQEACVLLMRASLALSSDQVNGHVMLILRQGGMNDLIRRLERLAA